MTGKKREPSIPAPSTWRLDLDFRSVIPWPDIDGDLALDLRRVDIPGDDPPLLSTGGHRLPDILSPANVAFEGEPLKAAIDTHHRVDHPVHARDGFPGGRLIEGFPDL